MEKEVNVLGIISEILKDADREIAAVFKKHFTEEELDNSAYAIMAYSLAWDAMCHEYFSLEYKRRSLRRKTNSVDG